MGTLPPSFDLVLTATEPLARRFAAAGHPLYLVGGVVRDRLLDVPLGDEDDIDCTTDAEPDVIHRIVAPVADAVWLQGAAFGTVGCLVGGRAFEITTHRAEQYRTASRKPVVAYASDIATDLSRRDFTVNAMAVSLSDGTLVDPFGGRHDLAAGVLRTPIEPEVSVDDDPLRMLRAARFVAALGLEPVTDLEDAVRRRAERLRIVSAERVHGELTRLLRLPAPSSGMRFLRRTGVLRFVLPEPAALPDPVFDRVLDALDAVPGDLGPDRRVLARFLVALCGQGPGEAEASDAGASWQRLLRVHVADHAAHLRWSRHERSVTGALGTLVPRVVLHGQPWTPAAVRSVIADMPSAVDVELLVAASVGAAAAAGLPATSVGGFAASADELAATEGLDADLPIDGRDVMAVLGIGAGEVVGRALAELRRARIDEGPMDRDAAVERLLAWWRQGGSGATTG